MPRGGMKYGAGRKAEFTYHINGVIYKSLGLASGKEGVSRSTIHRWCNDPNKPDCFKEPISEELRQTKPPKVKRARLTETMRNAVMERDGNECVFCGSTEVLNVDHIKPLQKGGKTVFENLQTLCSVCNNRKKDHYRDLPQGIKDDAEDNQMDPLDYMLSVINDPQADKKRKDYLAVQAAPYVHPRADKPKGKKTDRQDRAKAASGGKFAPSAPPKVIQGGKK